MLPTPTKKNKPPNFTPRLLTMKQPALLSLTLILAWLTLAVSSPAMPPQPSEIAPDSFEDPLIIEIQKHHTQSEQGDKKATLSLIEKLESLLLSHPENQLYKAYLGSAYTLRSRDIGFGPSAYSHLKKGLKTMDEAVAADPHKPSVRFIRAINNFHLPVFVNRRDNAREDFEYLLKQLEKKPGQLSPTTEQAICYYAGVAFLQLYRKEEAKKTFLKAAAYNADSQLNQKIQAELKKL
jgi:hypothetical protein